MHRLLWMIAVVMLLACPDSGSNSNNAKPQSLLLVEAELASKLRTGKLPADAVCEAEVPYLELRGSSLEMRCGDQADLDTVVEETEVKGVRQLKTRGGRTLKIETVGRERYRIAGSLCDKKPTVYIVFSDAKSYRETWLKGASCPTEAMKLAE